MLFAFDHNDNRVHIDETKSNQQYFCPFCGTPLIMKKGEMRRHHFAHKSCNLCTDSWERNGSYDMSPWHNDWQSEFPKDNQEVRLTLGEAKHRADILTGKTVIEFQNSILTDKAFDNRNNFYYNLGYKVVWLFNLSDLLVKGRITFTENDSDMTFYWKNPRKAFNSYDVKTGCIDLFFQLSEVEENCIVRVKDVSEFGFEEFYATKLMSRTAFLRYVGLENGVCPLPDREDLGENGRYLKFKEKYGIHLNKQQERALQSVEGANLLLAVPGSGKTTVLVDRLGYMVLEKGINPKNILAVTFNKNAAEEMKKRCSDKFGHQVGDQIDFRTINALSYEIYTNFCRRIRKDRGNITENNELRKVHHNIYKKIFPDEYPNENDFQKFSRAVGYIKNMMWNDKNIAKFDGDYPKFSQMYTDYQDWLKKNNQMDFDDQMVFALKILQNRPEVLSYWQKRYKYICVDEAQDTSKIQHTIIRLLAEGNNLFMVGDEDQSIYGFRGAYPKALLNFRFEYKNPYILRMERNYRSTTQIIEKAQSFISRNKGRYEKNMVSDRGEGEKVELIPVVNIEQQYQKILNVAKNVRNETAFLYRDNASSVILIDFFLRNEIDFKLKKPEQNFFEYRAVQDIVDYLKVAINPYDTDSFSQICNHGIFYLKKQQLNYAIKNVRQNITSIYDALDGQMAYISSDKRGRAAKFRRIMNQVSEQSSEEAIRLLLQEGYEQYIEEKNLDSYAVNVLSILARQEPDISKFLLHLTKLRDHIMEGFPGSERSVITLSTIHSSKGLEYDTVYIVDVYDGRFPSSKKNTLSCSKDNADEEQEERRLFYVGITRAKNKLVLFNMSDKRSSYIEELFPEVAEKRNQEAQEKTRKIREEQEMLLKKQRQEALRQKQEQEETRKKAEQADYEKRYNEVKDLFTQQETPILDSKGERWIQCEKCEKIFPASCFPSYGGRNHVNIGVCQNCRNKKNI